MFSKELENLINATLEDGILEDYEKAALVKRANAEGVDLAELEIYINSILQKRKRELAQAENARQSVIDQKKKEEFGRVCPACGKQIPPMTLKCECGYEIASNQSHVSSVQVLLDKIENVRSLPYKSEINTNAYDTEVKQRDEQVREIIRMFPVPNTKEDIIEFLALAAPNAQQKGGIWGTMPKRFMLLATVLVICSIITIIASGDGEAVILVMFFGLPLGIPAVLLIDTNTLKWNKNAEVWKAKFDQVLIKGRSMRGDSEFTQQLDYYESLFTK